MKKFVIFYCLGLDYDHIIVDAESFKDAVRASEAFHRETGAVILGVCPEHLLNSWCYDK